MSYSKPWFNLLLFGGLSFCCAARAADQPKTAPVPPPPGVVIDYSPASSRTYIGSPSIAIWTNGDYIVSHDFFGPGCSNDRSAIFRSSDRGVTWHKLAELNGQWWSTLFVHQNALYIIGVSRQYGQPVIRRSLDGGKSWTTPTNSTTGLLRADRRYHCAPVPVLLHQGRLWRAFEHREENNALPRNFSVGMFSAPADADLLHATNWITSTFLAGQADWLGGAFLEWIEGNAVATRDGQVLDLLRAGTKTFPEKAAMVKISADGRTASFEPATGFIDFPGGAKKFTVRFDPQSGLYWTLANSVPAALQKRGAPSSIRNTLALFSSPDLTDWRLRRTLLAHPEIEKHGFQYVDWLLDGADLVAVCRTAFDDQNGGAHNYHDANFLTFHRVADFRKP